MVRVQLTILVLALVLCSSTAEARGRRMMQQQGYQYYYPTQQTNVVYPASNVVYPTTNVVTTTPANGIVQASAVAPENTVSTANSGTTTGVPAPGTSAVGTAQWKAEQSARMGSVAHIGGGFGGGSFEGNGYGATAQQAIQNCCFWGQRTPIEIGVARGANGYYATVFYR